MRFVRFNAATLTLGFLFGLMLATPLPQQTACAQSVSGMTGVVTDQSGAAVPGVVVVLKNATTGSKYTVTTNATGVYRFSEIPPGQGYEAIFTGTGFATLSIKNIYLTIDTIRTQNATLVVGAHAEAVEVTAAATEVTIDTTTASIGNTFDVEALNSLPVQQRNSPTALFTMQPGVSDTGAVTGARVDQNFVTLDGLDVNDFATGGAVQSNTGAGIFTGFNAGSIVAHAPVDSVEEFHATVSGDEASTGPSSGGQFQLVTKSGTNRFHGNVNEYHRDTSLVANSWFSNNASPIVPRNHLIQNQFGGNIGGPIRKDKAFFFFDFNESRVVRSILVNRTVPLDSLRNGNVTYCTNSSSDCSTTGTLTPSQVAALDPAGIGQDENWVTAFNARFPHSNASGGDGINSGGYNFNAPDPDFETNYVTRIDYNLNDKMKVFGRFTILRENYVENPNEFGGDPISNPAIDRSYAFVVGHTWIIGTNKTNRAIFGEVVQKFSILNAFNPTGTTFFTFGDGADQALASSLYLNPNSQARRIPIPVVGDDFSWTSGSHTWQMGGDFKDILAHNTNAIDYNTTEVGLGGYVLGLCGPAANDCGNGVPSLRPADIDPGNELSYDEAFSFLLGRIANVQSDYNYDKTGSVLKQLTGDQRFYRYYQTQLYAQDAWKATPALTISYGLNYQLFSVPYETRGLESVEPFTFDQYFSARVAQSSLGQSGAQAVPLIAYYLGGKANHGPGLVAPEYRNIAPHLGFVWNPGFDKKSVINGSAGIVYDRTVINAIQASQDADSYLFQQTKPTPLGISGDPYDSVLQDPRVGSNLSIAAVTLVPPASPKAPYQPFVSDGVPNGLQNGLAFNATIDPSLKTPYSIIFNAGVQRTMPWDTVIKVNYASRLGRRLLGQADANQVLDFVDPASGEGLAAALASVTKQKRQKVPTASLAPEPWFEDVLDPNLGASYGFASNTQFLYANIGGLIRNGDFGDFVQALSSLQEKQNQGTNIWATPYNVGSAAQFSENTFFTNKGFSSYNGLLLTLQKNMSHGLHYDFNYTWSHSIDNVSLFANAAGDTGIGGGGLICDVVRPRECRANSDFDVKHIISGDATYQLPFGKGRMFLPSPSYWLNEVIGDWDISGVTDWHTGQAWGTNSNAFVASYSNDAPGIFIGSNRSVISTNVNKHAVLSSSSGTGVTIFQNSSAAAASYEGPIGFQIGPRNSLRGPRYFNADLGLAKTFPVYAEKVNMKFRADAFNAFNHPNFALPAENVFNGYDQQDILQGANFGQLNFTVEPPGNLNNGARVVQLSLRLEF